MRRSLVLLALVGCAYAAKQEKHEEAEIATGASKVVEEEPTVKEEFAAAAFPGQPLQDRLRARQVKGAKKTTLEDWQKASMGSDEHLEVKASVGPTGLASWLGWIAIIAGVLGAAGFAAWKLKPAWLGWLFKLLGRAPSAPPSASP